LTWFEKAAAAGLDNGDVNFGWGYALFKLGKQNAACTKWQFAAAQGNTDVVEFITKFCKE
jgi:hypothetical protein